MVGDIRPRILTWTARDELERVRRVSDQLCSAHAGLRDKYGQRALILDLVVLTLSTWLVAIAFVDPLLNLTLTPFGWDARLWSGALAIEALYKASCAGVAARSS